jgi:ABC-type amino acid transport substrate-binding protein
VSTKPNSPGRALVFALSWSALVLLIACDKKVAPTANTEQSSQQAAPAPSNSPIDETPAPSSAIVLPLSYARDTGDLDHMVKRRNIRALLIMNPIGFFYDKGMPRGVMYEALEEFQRFVNTKLKTRALAVRVTFVPMRIDQVESALTEGVGDLVAFGVVMTPEREQRVAFSSPIATDVTQIIVTGSSFGPVSTLADLGGKTVYANPLTTYYQNLKKAMRNSKRPARRRL